MKYYIINKANWEKNLKGLTGKYLVYASVNNGNTQDYQILSPSNITEISYNTAKPVTPLKSFFLPVRENVSSLPEGDKPRIIIGVPNCDVEAIRILDEIYLDDAFEDIFYRYRRENTLIISTDCFIIQEHCHCTAYGIRPFAEKNADISVILYNGSVILREISAKGADLINKLEGVDLLNDTDIETYIDKKRREVEVLLDSSNTGLPGYQATGKLVENASMDVWRKHSVRCVSCGACTTICPTCSCFLLIDKPGFHKVKQMDACQYPGFERVAGGEDALHELALRFMNRYKCKYVWKPERFKSLACTGCGRCIEACIGRINKNEIFRELAK